jgi:hypothetical protein
MVRCARSRVGAEGSVGSVRFVAVGQGAPRETREEGARDIAASRSGFCFGDSSGRCAHQPLGLVRHVVEHRTDPVILRQALLVRHGLVPEVGAYRALQPLDLLVGLARALEQRGRHGTRAGLICGPRGASAPAGQYDLESRQPPSAVCSEKEPRGFFLLREIHRHNSSALRWARGGG